MRKILYLCPLMPSKSGNGGRRAAYNHLLDLASGDLEIDAVLIDVEETFPTLPVLPKNISPKVFPRALPKFAKNNLAKILALKEHIFNQLPRALRVISSKEARNFILHAVQTRSYDALMIDHFNAYGLIRGFDFGLPLIYIAHNVEVAVLEHQISQISTWRPSRLLRAMDVRKVMSMELEICERATSIILISGTDSEIPPISYFKNKIVVWPELPTPKSLCWRPNNRKQMLFVGSAKYFPNRDAIEWLAGTFLPRIRQSDHSITLKVAGTAPSELAREFHTEGVSYLGFVSDSELERLHLESTLFICPVVLGSGIKIKVLEASSYGIPIAATSESLNGIDYLSENAIRFSRDNSSDIDTISRLMANTADLQRISNASTDALNYARNNRVGLKEVIESAVG